MINIATEKFQLYF